MAHVGCAGILVKDTFCGPVVGLPRPGELVAVDTIITRAGGCAANVAIDLGKQGVAVDLVGCIGQDPAGGAVIKQLQAAQVDCNQIIYTSEYPTSETVILLVQGEDRRYLHTFGANRAFTVNQIDRKWLARLRVFYLGGLFALPGIITEDLIDLLAFCRDREIVTVLDVVLSTGFNRQAEMIKLLPHVDWFLPNDTEAALLTGETDPRKAIRIFREWDAHNLIVTAGEKGAIAVYGDECWRCDAYPGATIDPSGAGDAFASGLITGLVNDWEFPRTFTFASVLGASATWAVGTTAGVLTQSEATRLLAENPLTVACADP
ncbi:MAG: carbohydrate kinase family protein [Verrucomicrobia bacterium]|nr:carbohydrate kinase family protein [Verrucomicrobiota bacterium]